MLSLNKSLGEEMNEEKEKKTYKKRGPQYIQPTVANFKRSKRGYALMRQELKRLLVTQAKRMPSKALMDGEEKTIEYSFQNHTGTISVEKFLLLGPEFLDAYFTDVRKRIMFGAKVQSWLQAIDHAISDYKPKQLHELVAMVASFKPASMKGYQDDADGSDDVQGEDGECDEDGEEDANE